MHFATGLERIEKYFLESKLCVRACAYSELPVTHYYGGNFTIYFISLYARAEYNLAFFSDCNEETSYLRERVLGWAGARIPSQKI